VGLGDSFIDLFILANPTKEISLCKFGRGILVIGISRSDLQSHICRDDGRVVADRLEKNQKKPLLPCNALFNVCSELHRGEFVLNDEQ